MDFLKQLTRLSIVTIKYWITCLHLFILLNAYSCYNKVITCKHTVVDLLLLIIIIIMYYYHAGLNDLLQIITLADFRSS